MQDKSEVVQMFSYQIELYNSLFEANVRLKEEIKKVLDIVEQQHIFNGIFQKYCRKIEDLALSSSTQDLSPRMKNP